MKFIYFFLYSFFLHTVFQLAFFYAEDNFRKPLGGFSQPDMFRVLLILVVLLSYFRLIPQLFDRFEELSKRSKLGLTILSFIVSTVCTGFLLAVYFER
ncbi:hypothetical protein [Halobacillus litoralis]|uniref:hypothetical protein n=1 Tax=Halobacillus litoralis TaxID=45668 RepID=UPI001CFDF555|nr:hypothetical protein [Halobacillus litoralis]